MSAPDFVQGPIFHVLQELQSGAPSHCSLSPPPPDWTAGSQPPDNVEDSVLENPLFLEAPDAAGVAHIARTLTNWLVSGPPIEALSKDNINGEVPEEPSTCSGNEGTSLCYPKSYIATKSVTEQSQNSTFSAPHPQRPVLWGEDPDWFPWADRYVSCSKPSFARTLVAL